MREIEREVGAAVGWRAQRADGELEARLLEMTESGIAGLEGELGLTELRELPDGAVCVHCWRGGLRSRSVAAFLRGFGLEAVVLQGGYKSYRREVIAELDGLELPRTFSLRGLTGVGKTLVLRELERQRPDWTLDLEGLAGHRSSILGMVGLEPCSQKAFDSRLLEPGARREVDEEIAFGSAPHRALVAALAARGDAGALALPGHVALPIDGRNLLVRKP